MTRGRRARITASRSHHSSTICGRSFLPSGRPAMRAASPSSRRVGSSSRSGAVTAARDTPRHGRTGVGGRLPSSCRSMLPRVFGCTQRSRGAASISSSGAGRRSRVSSSTSCSARRGETTEQTASTVTWSRWFGQLEGLVKVYSDCEITPSSSSAPALTGGCHGWHEAGSYPDIDDDDALWNCGNLAAGAQAWAAALAREISNAMRSSA